MRRSETLLFVLLLFVVSAMSSGLGRAWAQENEEELSFWLGVANRYMSFGNYEQAATAFRRILKTMPDHPDAIQGLAEAMEKQGRPGRDAVVAPTEAPLDAPPPLESEDDLMQAYRRAVTPEEREKVAQRLGEFHLRQAKILERDQKKAQAMLHFRKARVLGPRNALVHYEIFKAFIARKRMQEAIKAAGDFLDLQGYGALASEVRRQLLEVHLTVGDRCVKRSRWEDAADHFRRVLELDARSRQAAQAVTKLALVHYTLSSTFHAKGRWVDSARHLEGLLKLKDMGEDVAKEVDEEYGKKILKFAVGAFWRAAKAQEPKDKLEALQFYRRVHEISPWSNYGKGAKEAMVRLKQELRIKDTIGAVHLYQADDPTAPQEGLPSVPVQPPPASPTLSGSPPVTIPRSAVPSPDVVLPDGDEDEEILP